MARTKVDDLPTIDYATDMVEPLVRVAQEAGALGVRPVYLQVQHDSYEELVNARPWTVSMQADTVAEVDRIADHYVLDADDGEGANYLRKGVAVLDGIGEITVRVYAGHPDDGAEAGR